MSQVKRKMMIINRMLKININLMARGGGYYLPLNKNNKGVSELVGLLSHHQKNYVNPTYIGD